MNLKNKTEIKILLKSIFFLALFAFAIQVGAVWTSPTSSAPGNNAKPPVNEGSSTQLKKGNFTAQALKATTAAILEGTLQIPGGVPPLDGKVLTSDANGFASWQTFTGGDGGNVDNNNIDGTTNYVTKWTGPHTIGNSQIFDNTTGVGIATTSPASGVKLDVNGKVKMTGFQLGSTATVGHVLTADAEGNGTWLPYGSGGGNGWTRDSATQVVRLTNFGDEVGVGIENPLQQLQLSGNFKLPNTSHFFNNGAPGVGWIFIPDPNLASGRFIHNLHGTYIGERAGQDQLYPSGINNTGIGFYSIVWGSDGNDNTALGHHTLVATDLENANTVLGTSSVDGHHNTSVGSESLSYHYPISLPCCEVIQNNNSALGRGAVLYDESIPAPSTRNNNAVAGAKSFGINKDGSNNTGLGYNAEFGANNLSNASAIGANTIVNSSNKMIFGDASIYAWGFGVQAGSGNAIKVGDDATNGNGATLTNDGYWTQGSDRNKKHNIQDIAYGLEEIIKLRPVSFDWNGTNNHDIGFIAQEVKEVIPEVVSGVEGEMTVSYSAINAVLAKALQELKEENDLLKYETSLLEKELE